jgi:hypothetical protein
MGDNKLTIIIETQAQLDALKQVRDHLAELKAGTAEGTAQFQMLNATTESLDKVIKRGVGASIPEAGHGLELFGMKGREAHMALRLLGSSLGEVGHLIHFAFMPELAVIAAFAIGIREAKGALDEYNKSLDEAAKAAEAPWTSGPEAVRKAWDEAKDHLGQYLAALQHAGEADPLTGMIARQKELDEARLESARKEIQNQGQITEATIREEGVRLHLTQMEIEAQVEAAKAGTQAQLDRLELTKKSGELQREMTERTQQRQTVEAAAAEAQRKATELEQEADKRKTQKEAAARLLAPDSEINKQLTAAQDRLSKAQANYTGGGFVVGPSGQVVQSGTSTEELEKAKAEVARLTATLNGASVIQGQMANSEVEFSKKLAIAQKTRQEAEAEAEKNAQRLAELPTEIDQARQLANIQRQSQADTAAAKVTEEAKKRQQEWLELQAKVDKGGGTPEEQRFVARRRVELSAAQDRSLGVGANEYASEEAARKLAEADKLTLRNLEQQLKQAKTLEDRANILAQMDTYIQGLGDTIAVMTGYHENTARVLAAHQPQIAAALTRLKALETQYQDLKGRLQNVAGGVPP